MRVKVDAIFSSLSLIEMIYWYFWLSTSIRVVNLAGSSIDAHRDNYKEISR